MTTLDQALAGARRVAASAALRGLGTKSCPYPANGNNTQRAARREFYAEYLRRRPLLTRNIPLADDLDYMAYGDGDGGQGDG